QLLMSAGVDSLVAASAMITFKGKNPPDLLELQIEPHAVLTSPGLPSEAAECSACGRRGIRKPDHIIIDSSSVPLHLDVFRLRNVPTVILASERFADAVHNLKLTGVLMHRVDIMESKALD